MARYTDIMAITIKIEITGTALNKNTFLSGFILFFLTFLNIRIITDTTKKYSSLLEIVKITMFFM